MLSFLRKVTSSLFSDFSRRKALSQLKLQSACDAIRSERRFQDPKSIVPFGFKSYSQGDEDGILQEIFKRIGTTNKIFLEIGIGDGLENNTAYLLMKGWSGLWLDYNPKTYQNAKEKLSHLLASKRLQFFSSFVTAENIEELIRKSGISGEMDLLSIDIDGNDFHIWKSIKSINPRVIVVEYNAKFPPPVEFCIPYDPSQVWDGSDYFGASLSFWCRNLEGYSLVGTSITGANGFFVRNDLLSDHFHAPFTAEHHYQPARYYLTLAVSGHASSFRALDTSDSALPI